MPRRSAEVHRTPLLIAVTLSLCAHTASVARADIVPPRPARCPDGSIPQTSHSGPFCWVPGPCKADESCKSYESDAKTALVCRPTAVCVKPKALFKKAGGKTDVPEATGSCESGAACDPGAKCERESRCAPRIGGSPSSTSDPTGPRVDAGPPLDTTQPAPAASSAPAPSSEPTPSPAPRSSCFCGVPTSSTDSIPACVGLLTLAALLGARRRAAALGRSSTGK